MTSLPTPQPGAKKLGLVIDLDTCVGCHACVVSCKEWNAFGETGPLPEFSPYQAEPGGVWLNRVHTFEIGDGEGSLVGSAGNVGDGRGGKKAIALVE